MRAAEKATMVLARMAGAAVTVLKAVDLIKVLNRSILALVAPMAVQAHMRVALMEMKDRILAKDLITEMHPQVTANTVAKGLMSIVAPAPALTTEKAHTTVVAHTMVADHITAKQALAPLYRHRAVRHTHLVNHQAQLGLVKQGYHLIRLPQTSSRPLLKVLPTLSSHQTVLHLPLAQTQCRQELEAVLFHLIQ